MGLLTAQLAVATQAAQLSARAWLNRMDKALQQINYEGTFVYLHDNRVDTMQITHRADGRGGVERLLSLNGSPREIIRKHHSLTCILPDSRSVVVEKHHAAHPFPGPLTNTDTDVLQSDYTFKTGGKARVAGHECQIVAIQPKDQYRYGYRLWLDENTGIPAKSTLIGKHGHVIEEVMFTRLKFPAKIPDSALKPSIDHKGYTWSIQGERSIPHDPHAVAQWRVTRLPPGFSLSLNEFQHVAGARAPVRHMVFTDGLASVSVFAEPADSRQPQLHGLSRMGAVNAYGRVLDGHQITVVGEVPAKSVRMIGESIKLHK
jgi:sigma-E factor negative regulatory protein RseB